MSNPIRVIILSRKDCHLCDVVYRMAVRLQLELHIDIKKISVEGDTDLMERHGARVPVVLLDDFKPAALQACTSSAAPGLSLKRSR